ncbi:UNVERIFIED_CONTAM: hypothetical protein Sangu_2359400 [Sesamum angustifolium]|uniref:Zinc finger LSD1-type domain-containing protein n=1 Tax=Sesamum angustifolium TaxID=2727405 RepID=A0AAW2KVJ3_9LAMI
MDEDRKQDIATEREEDDDGRRLDSNHHPRPRRKRLKPMTMREEKNGPPLDFTRRSEIPPSLPPDMARSSKQDDIDDDEDGPPPGWEFSTLVILLIDCNGSTTVRMQFVILMYFEVLLEVGRGERKGGQEATLDNCCVCTRPVLTGRKGSASLWYLPQIVFVSTRSKMGPVSRDAGKSILSLKMNCKVVFILIVVSSGGRSVLFHLKPMKSPHDVGQVKCGGCSVLLMYPHGAPAVQCTTCHFVTEIGAHNRRPPLSVQQAQARDGVVPTELLSVNMEQLYAIYAVSFNLADVQEWMDKAICEHDSGLFCGHSHQGA